MSDKALGRRVDIAVHAEGVDISEDIKKSLISLSYTDNEEDSTDDLQIKMHDIDGIWLREWLNDTVQSAAVAGVLAGNKEEYHQTIQGNSKGCNHSQRTRQQLQGSGKTVP